MKHHQSSGNNHGVSRGLQKPRWLFVVLVLILSLSLQSASARTFRFNFNKGAPQENPYEVLGVRKIATAKEIKHAYRTLAKEHHPDKGGKPEAFARISNAYEILSDPTKRRHYDQTGQFQQQTRSRPAQQQQKPKPRPKPKIQTVYQRKPDAKSTSENRKKFQEDMREKLRKEEQAKEAEREMTEARRKVRSLQRDLPKVTEIDELIELGFFQGKDLRFKKNVIIAFVSNKRQEDSLMDDFLFPYPFSGEGRNGINWDEVIMTTKVRYNKSTKLTSLFRVPPSHKTSPYPYIIFGKANDQASRFYTFVPPVAGSPKDIFLKFHNWIQEERLKATVRVFNNHKAPVKIFKATGPPPLKPARALFYSYMQTVSADDSTLGISVTYGDLLVVVDAKTDAFPGAILMMNQLKNTTATNGALLKTLLVEKDSTMTVPNSKCFDLSLKCVDWAKKASPLNLFSTDHSERDACKESPEFMQHICPFACGFCKGEHPSDDSRGRGRSISILGSLRMLQHWANEFARHTGNWLATQLGRDHWPQWLRYMEHDLQHMLEMRQGVVALCVIVGFVCGINIYTSLVWILGGFVFGSSEPASKSGTFWRFPRARSLLLAGFVMFDSKLLEHTNDMEYMFKVYPGAIPALLACGFGYGILLEIEIAREWFSGINQRNRFLPRVISSFLLTAASFTLFVSLMGEHTIAEWKRLLSNQYKGVFAIWSFGLVTAISVFPLTMQFFWNLRKLILLTALNVGCITGIATWIVLDSVLVRDLMHVLEMRMNAASLLAIVSIGLGYMLTHTTARFIFRTELDETKEKLD